MYGMAEKMVPREAKHKHINGKKVVIEYSEYPSPEGDIMVRYSAIVDGKPFPLRMEIPKNILQSIHSKFDNKIYHIIPDSFLETIKELTSTQLIKFLEAKI